MFGTAIIGLDFDLSDGTSSTGLLKWASSATTGSAGVDAFGFTDLHGAFAWSYPPSDRMPYYGAGNPAGPFAGLSATIEPAPIPPETTSWDASPATSISAPPASGFWINEGPAPGIDGQEDVAPDDQINGAIQAIAVDPTNADVMYIGSVNGGIWKTTNATDISPHWVPLTDDLPSLSIGAVEFDPTDATHQTLIAGIGATSSFGALHDTLSGVLRSTNGGVTWSQLGTADLSGESITSVAARGATLLAAAYNGPGAGLGDGLFRSTDTGAHWTKISDGTHGLPDSKPVSEIVGDPLNSNVFYAAVTGASGGVFKSTDSGLTWTNISSGIGIIGSTTDKIELAVHHDGSNLAVYAKVDNGGILSGVFRSQDGGSFQALDVPSGGKYGNLFGAIAADPDDANIVYVGLGGSGSHLLTRIDASQPSGSQITDITGDSSNSFGTPHADSRAMQIDANGDLILGNDGGLFRLTTPTTDTGAWSAIVGDMSVFELHSIAYDSVSNIIMAGAQDNGTQMQQTPGGAVWDHPSDGDGGDVAIDDVSLAGTGESIRYFSSQNLGGWTRQVYDAENNFVSTTDLASITDAQFLTPVELNNVDPTRILVGGTGHIYELVNQGTTLTSLVANGTNSELYGGGIMVYGGYQGGVANPDLIYAASGANVLVQTASGGGFSSASPGGSSILGVTCNPTDWADVFAIDNNQVFQSTNTGANWSDVTANLTSISAADFRSIEYVHGPLGDALVVGTSSGVFFTAVSALGGGASWSELGSNLPDVISYDLEFDSTDNVLVVGTMGRGAWLASGATYRLGVDEAADLIASNAALNSVNLTYTIDNAGNKAAVASTTRIFLSADSAIETSDTQVATDPLSALGIGASDAGSISLLSLVFPGNLTPGSYFLGAVADSDGLITEIDEGNNASNGVPVIVGNDNGNALNGTASAEGIIGLGGNDSLNGNTGNDVVLGGNGDDVITDGALNASEGRDTIFAGNGNDTVLANYWNSGEVFDGGADRDLIDLGLNSANNFVDLIAGHIGGSSGSTAVSLSNFEDVKTGAGNDTIVGSATGSLLDGRGGNDNIQGGAGNDFDQRRRRQRYPHRQWRLGHDGGRQRRRRHDRRHRRRHVPVQQRPGQRGGRKGQWRRRRIRPHLCKGRRHLRSGNAVCHRHRRGGVRVVGRDTEGFSCPSDHRPAARCRGIFQLPADRWEPGQRQRRHAADRRGFQARRGHFGVHLPDLER